MTAPHVRACHPERSAVSEAQQRGIEGSLLGPVRRLPPQWLRGRKNLPIVSHTLRVTLLATAGYSSSRENRRRPDPAAHSIQVLGRVVNFRRSSLDRLHNKRTVITITDRIPTPCKDHSSPNRKRAHASRGGQRRLTKPAPLFEN